VISIDAKKKELLGEYKNGGSDYGPQGQPIEVNTHDFEIRNWARSSPTGSTTSAPTRLCQLGIDHDTGNSPSTPFASGSNR